MAEGFQRRQYFQPSGVDSGAAAAFGTLSDRLSQFANRAHNLGEGIASIEGEQEGAEAGAKGTPTLRSNLTAHGRAYNDAAVRNYTISKYTEMEKELTRIETESGSDPDKFVTAAQGLRTGALKDALPQSRGLLATLYTRRIAEGASRLIQKHSEEQKALNAAMLAQGAQVLTDSISRKLVSGDPRLMAEAAQEEDLYSQLLDGAVESGDLAPAEAFTLKADGAKRVTEQIIYGQFEQEMQDGDPVSYIARVMTQPVENLSDDEKQALVGNLFQRLNRHQALLTEANATEEAEQKARWKEGDREATLAMLQGRLTQKQLARMVENDQLEPSVARTLENDLQSGTKGSDDPAVKFAVETNLLGYEEEDIARMGGLSYDTRAELILKRRAESETWRNDQGAQEALRRIDVALGIPAGLGPQFTMTVSPEKATAAARARSYFYDLIESLPEDERKAKYFEMADKAVGETGKDVKLITLEKQRKALANYLQSAPPVEDMDEQQLKDHEATVKRREAAISKLEQETAR